MQDNIKTLKGLLKSASRVEGKKLKYRPEIDGLRVLAVIPVLLFHMDLSEKRSKRTQDAMQMMGVSGTQTAIRFFGESSPVSINTTDSGRQENRRVTVTAVY